MVLARNCHFKHPAGTVLKDRTSAHARATYLYDLLQNFSLEAGVYGETMLESPLAPRIEHLSLILVASATPACSRLLFFTSKNLQRASPAFRE